MTSLLTNVAALGALQTLRGIDADLEESQTRISSGLRVKEAADNAAYWSIATTMKSDQSALSTVVDALGLAAAKTDTTNAGLMQTLDIVKKIKDKIVAASEPGVSKAKVGTEIEQLKEQLKSVAMSASFSGENWMYNPTTAVMPVKKMVGALTRDSGTISIQTIDFDAAKTVMLDKGDARRGLLTKKFNIPVPGTTTTQGWYLINITSNTGADGPPATQPANNQQGGGGGTQPAANNNQQGGGGGTQPAANNNQQGGGGGTQPAANNNNNNAPANPATKQIQVNDNSTENEMKMMLSAISQILDELTEATADLGAVKSRVDSQNSFVKSMVDVIEKGVGQLVDADMNEESTRLKALQTQQQLGIQSLSIANTNAANIMQLFRNG